jgi:hypothetical protein
MRTAATVRQLREIEDIRAVQLRATELDALQSAALVEAREIDHQNRLRDLESAEAGWRRSVDDGAIGDPTAFAWSSAIRLGLDATTDAIGELEVSRAANARAVRRLQEAESHHQVAMKLVAAASRRLASQLQEARDADLSDLHLIRRARR